MPLTGNQRRYLRALAHHLDPIVQVGHQGVTEGVGRALSRALNDHELVKVKVAPAVEDRTAAAEALAADTGAELVQQMGRTLVFYKRRKKDPKIKVPPPRTGPGSKAASQPGKAAPAVRDDDDADGDEGDADDDEA